MGYRNYINVSCCHFIKGMPNNGTVLYVNWKAHFTPDAALHYVEQLTTLPVTTINKLDNQALLISTKRILVWFSSMKHRCNITEMKSKEWKTH